MNVFKLEKKRNHCLIHMYLFYNLYIKFSKQAIKQDKV